MVQEEIDRRKKYGSSYIGNSPFSTRLVCGECGSLYGTKVWHSNDKYRRTIFQCNGKFKNGKKCSTPHLTEEEVKALFIQAFNIIFEEKDRLIEDCKFAIDTLTDYSDIDAEIKNLITELDVI